LVTTATGSVPEPLYLFDGYNLLHAGGFAARADLVDRLASFVARRGARGVVVFDGVGEDATVGPLEVRYAPHADTLLERLAADHREREEVLLVSSDSVLRGTAGPGVKKETSREFVHALGSEGHVERERSELLDRLDDETLAKLERLRRGRS
jgi:predicted RNA-binding protein with PIN domain